MKYSPIIILLVILASSCKTEFEKIRSGNDPEMMYKAANQYFEEGSYLNAQVLYELTIPFYRGKKEAEDLYYKFAYTHYYLEEYILASHYFNNFSNSFYSSPNKEESDYMVAYSKYKLSPIHRLDQSYSREAIDELQGFMNSYPESERVEECNDLIDELWAKLELKAFDEGQLYYDLKNYNSAIKSFDNMLKDFPDTKRAEEVRFLMLKSSYNWAKNSIYEKKQERFEDCVENYKIFVKKYPRSKYKQEADKILSFTEQELNTI